MRWNDHLTHPIPLRTGAILVSLRDAAEAMMAAGEGVLKDETLAYAGKLLMGAAETGADADVVAATDQVRIALQKRALLPVDYRPKAQRRGARKQG